MATGLAIGVTVVGVAAILALLGILARQLGLWAWAWNWMKATNEEKTKLCYPERIPTNAAGGRPYLQLENDLDWINLWPRSGSYKRFSNLDDVNSEDCQLAAARIIANNMPPDLPIPPQPLRPAPGPPHRIPGRYDNDDNSSFYYRGTSAIMDMMMGGRIMRSHPDDSERGTLMTGRKDSIRSLNSRNRQNMAQDYQPEIISSLPVKASTNPFRSNPGITHSGPMYSTSHRYSNPFSPSYQYPNPRHFQAIEEDNRISHTLVDDRLRQGYGSALSRSDHHLYTNNYEEYSRMQPAYNHLSLDRGLERIHGQDMERAPFTDFSYGSDRIQSSSQIAYTHSLNQALAKRRKLQQNIQQLYINRYDKLKQDELRIREEERVLNQLRYENDLMRRERYENSLQNKSSFEINGLNYNIYDLEETQALQREAIRENIAYDLQRGASEIREEMQKTQFPQRSVEYDRRVAYDSDNYSPRESRDSPPPPAPDLGTNDLSYPESPELPSKESYNWRDWPSRRGSEGKSPLEIPATPPNTASLTPPHIEALSSTETQQELVVNPYSHSLIHERLAQVEGHGYKETNTKSSIDHTREFEGSVKANTESKLNLKNQNDINEGPECMYPNVFSDPMDDIGNELTQKLHALQEGKGIDIYPRALKERIERRREREGSRRKRKRERELERRSSAKQLIEGKSNEKINNPTLSPSTNLNNQNTMEIVTTVLLPCDNTTESVNTSTNDASADVDPRQESALNYVPIGLTSETSNTNQVENIEQRNLVLGEQEKSANILSVSNVMCRNLGSSPVIPRKSFLSYKDAWNLDDNSAEENEIVEPKEDDPSTIRVREYIASLSARLQQLPSQEEEPNPVVSPTAPPNPPSTSTSPVPPSTPPQMTTPPPTVVFPVTPPYSATRTDSQSSTDTPLSTAATWGSVHAWRFSTDTPPSSAGLIGNTSSPRHSYSETPPSSAGYCAPTPPNSASSSFVDTPPTSAGYPGSPPNSSGLNGSFDLGPATPGGTGPPLLMRASSFDSVNSDTSVTLGELEEEGGQITGYLTVQVLFDCDTADLEVLVVEGRDLVGPDVNTTIDSYVRVFLLPDKSTNMQTRVAKKSNNPAFRERFLFALEEDELIDRSLVFYVYASEKFTNTLIGEAQIKLADMDVTSSTPTELALIDSGQKGTGYGEIMFSLSYLPTAERLTVVVVKARSLQFSGNKSPGDPFVKVYILQNGKKIMKKKTIVKRGTNSPLFNEAMIFSIPAPALHNIQLRLTVADYPGDNSTIPTPVGHVIVGTQATGKALSHWNQMMSSLRKPIAMWHALRR